MINEVAKTKTALEVLGIPKQIKELEGKQTILINQKPNLSPYSTTDQSDSRYLKLNQSTPQTVISGAPIFNEGLTSNSTFVCKNGATDLGLRAYWYPGEDVFDFNIIDPADPANSIRFIELDYNAERMRFYTDIDHGIGSGANFVNFRTYGANNVIDLFADTAGDSDINLTATNVTVFGSFHGQDVYARGDSTTELLVQKQITSMNRTNVTGSGSLMVGGVYTNAADLNYKVEITTGGEVSSTGVKFKWSDDGGSTWDATGVTVPQNGNVTLNNGINIVFISGTGTDFNVGDYITFTMIGTANQIATLKCDSTNDKTYADNLTVTGYIDTPGSLQDEKLTNGTFTGNANSWTLGSGWAYGTNNVAKTAGGTATLSQLAVDMVTPIITDEYYTLSFDVTMTEPDVVTITCGGVTVGIIGETVLLGTIPLTYTFKATNTDPLVFTPLDASRITLDNISLRKIVGHIRGGSLLIDGTVCGVPASGAGTRLMWVANQAAFRAGKVTGTQWNKSNIGDYSFASGSNTTASGGSSTSMGYDCVASGAYSLSVGESSTASGSNSIALGASITSSGAYSFASGKNTIASGDYSTALNYYTTAEGTQSTAIGIYTHALGQGSFVGGGNANLDTTSLTTGITKDGELGQFAFGYASTGHTLKAQGTASIAMGQDVNALTNPNVIVFGRHFDSNVQDSFNIGFGQLDYEFKATAADFKDSSITTTGTGTFGTTGNGIGVQVTEGSWLQIGGSGTAPTTSGIAFGDNSGGPDSAYVRLYEGTDDQINILASLINLDGPTKISTSSTTALLVEDDGVVDNVLIADTATYDFGSVGVGIAPTAQRFHIGYGHLRFDQWAAPTSALTCALAGAGAGNVDNGTHYYRVRYKTEFGTTESGPVSGVVTVVDKTTNGKVALSNIPTGPAGTTAREIYRTPANLGPSWLFYLLTTINDNTTTTYTDNTADSGLGAGFWFTDSENTTAGKTYVGADQAIFVGRQNSAIGKSALGSLTTGTGNTGVGVNALKSLTTAGSNCAFGYGAGYKNISGGQNTLIGVYAGYYMTSHSTSAVGYWALANATGKGNSSLGRDAGRTITSGTYNTIFGYGAGYTGTTNSISYTSILGAYGQATTSNTLVLGGGTNAASDQGFSTIAINGKTNTDIAVNFYGTSNSGLFTWMEDEDYFQFNDDINLVSGEVLKVNAVQVVGAQGAAVADATDAASVILRLNDLLARCRAHGLIAT